MFRTVSLCNIVLHFLPFNQEGMQCCKIFLKFCSVLDLTILDIRFCLQTLTYHLLFFPRSFISMLNTRDFITDPLELVLKSFGQPLPISFNSLLLIIVESQL